MVIALALMAFVVMALLSMSLLVSIETKLTATTNQQTNIKQNALLGLMTALGELQSSAGPDSRITARADIFDTTPATPTIDGVENPYWLAVFKAVEDGEESQPLESLRTWATDITAANRVNWLVSSRNNLSDGTHNPLTTDAANLNNNNVVQMAAYENANGGTDDVFAGKVDIQRDGSTVGRFAWWVADENAKYRINKVKPEEVLNSAFEDTWALMAPHRSNAAIINELSNFDVDSASQQAALQKTQSPRDLSHITRAWEDWSKAHADDITFTATSIPVDVTQGKLKQDLTVYLESNNSGLNDSQPIVRHNNDPDYTGRLGTGIFALDDNAVDVPHFGLMKNWFEAGTGVRGLAGGTAPSPRAHTVEQYGVHPVVMRVAIYFTPSYWIDTGTGNVYLAFLVYPKFVMWNPHNVPIAPAKYAIQVRGFTTLNTQINVDGVDYAMYNSIKSFGYKCDGLSKGHFNMANTGNPNALKRDPDDQYPYFTFIIDNEGFAPGETLLYTASDKHPNSAYVNHDISALKSPTVNPSNYNLLVNENMGDLGFFTLRLQSQLTPDIASGSTATGMTDATDIMETYFFFNDTSTGSPDGNAEPSLSTKLYLLADGDAELLQFINLREDSVDRTAIDWENINNEGWSEKEDTSYDPLSNPTTFRSLSVVENDPFEASAHWGSGYYTTHMGESTTANRAFRLFYRYNPVARDYDALDPLFLAASIGQTGASYGGPPPSRQWFNGGGAFPSDIPGDSTYAGIMIDGYDTLGCHALTYNNSILSASTVYPLFDFPRHETGLISLGFLTNCSFGQEYWQPSFPFGNSEATPHTDRNIISETHGGTTYYDLSYLLNESLWDRFYLSTLPQDTGIALSKDSVLPNTLHRICENANGSFPTDEQLRNTQTAFEQSAAHVVVEGGFNVNSTSVEAWKLLLASTLGEQVTSANGGDSNLISNAPTSARAYPLLPEYNGNPARPEVYSSLRSLDQNEIDLLATAIVEEVKRRGPFLSMADFVNRRLIGNSDNEEQDWLGLNGTLQAAINKVTVRQNEINEAFHNNNPRIDTHYAIPNPLYEEHEVGVPPAYNGSRMWGLPGVLTQGDLLSILAPQLTVRGDTFLIRAYGETVDPLSGETTGQAWCEALVKRRSAPVESGDSVIQPTGAFGRKFQIVSFRWLNDNEVGI